MPNSGYQGLINQHFYGENKTDIFPLGGKYGQQNLPCPAFWHAYIRGNQPAVHRGTDTRNKYSRHLNLSDPLAGVGLPSSPASSMKSAPSSEIPYEAPIAPSNCLFVQGGIKSNSVAPFATLAKPTCGWFFSRSTDHKKRRTGIPPADLVKWRYYVK
ncbi:uncharacterized protein LOC110990471 [Acanthaster planci]|uniref:Uncharacterized protein LOC110990471 n=1 Tax=Acanthaster planci TaxID=133434 RepID=A0A8B8A092_ACAPL|nr:uncharacterized protein LOC110990471 [Acanthaster planci]